MIHTRNITWTVSLIVFALSAETRGNEDGHQEISAARVVQSVLVHQQDGP